MSRCVCVCVCVAAFSQPRSWQRSIWGGSACEGLSSVHATSCSAGTYGRRRLIGTWLKSISLPSALGMAIFIVGRADWNISCFNRFIQQWKHIMKQPRNDFNLLETNIETSKKTKTKLRPSPTCFHVTLVAEIPFKVESLDRTFSEFSGVTVGHYRKCAKLNQEDKDTCCDQVQHVSMWL